MARQYRHVDAALLRASSHAGNGVSRPLLELDVDVDREQWCSWLLQVWSQPSVAQAVAIASPALANSVEAVCGGSRPGAREVRRMVLSVARYLARMRGRATPFGTFAGVAAPRFGQQTAVQWTDDHQMHFRPDAAWLSAVIARLEACPALRSRLSVIANDLAMVRGERLVIPRLPNADVRRHGVPVEVSIRHSPPVQMIMRATQSPTRVVDLTDKLAADIPDAARSAIEAMVATLIACGVLITSLRPPSTSADGLAHVLRQLQEADAAALPDIAHLVGELHQVQIQLREADKAPNWVNGHAWQAVSARMRAMTDTVEQPLIIDLRLGCTMVLPPDVADEAEAATEALLRLTPHPTGNPMLREYHGRFLDRYGPNAVVPVKQLVDPTAGLGFPRHYGEPPQSDSCTEMSSRDERLLALAQQAALDGEQEIVLDDAEIDFLAGHSDTVRLAPHVDLCVELRAPTTAALAEGLFTLAVTGIGATAIATSGRFLDILPDTDRQRMVRLYGQLPATIDGALEAQLSFPANDLHAQNVLHAPQVLPRLISVAEHHDEQDHISVHDLAVTADHNQMYLVSMSRRRVVEPVLACAAARHTMPALARLLFEIPRATNAAVSLFDWGAAKCLPFRPRVRYGRSILSAARWRIAVGRLPGPQASWRDWTAAVAIQRRRLHLPTTVHVGTGDRRLRLNLDDPLDLALLRDHVNKVGDAITVAEAPTPADHGWFDGRAHEITIPLVSTALPTRAPAVVTSSAPLPVIGREHGVLPGATVLYAQIYGHPDAFDSILTRHLPALLAMWDEAPMWWFVRYRTPTPHLRIRLHDLPDYGEAAARVGTWTTDLRHRGLVDDLVLNTYRPETGRYGSGVAMAAAEALFAADSAAVLAQLVAQSRSREVHARALAAASLVDLACAMAGSRSSGMRWLLDHDELVGRAPIGDRSDVRLALNLTGIGAGPSGLLNVPDGEQIAHAWNERRQAATRYRECLAVHASHVTPSSALVSLLHMHHVRAQGIDPAGEALSHRIARAVALAWKAQQDTTERGRR